MIETKFMKRAIGNIDGLVSYINQIGAKIKTSDVQCCGADWCRGAVLWCGAWYVIETGLTATQLDELVKRANKKYDELQREGVHGT